MKWRDALHEITDIIDAPDAGEKIREMMEAETAHRKATKPPKYKIGDTVQTHFTASPNRTMTQHEVIQVWTRAEGYKGASDAAYMLSPIPRGAQRYLDEGWLSPVTNTSTTKRSN